jgi:lipoyl(octanoyl) transferase
MDLAPFSDIDPCGYPGLRVTQTSALGVAGDAQDLGRALASGIARLLEFR